jgi:hypothetical protein
MAEAAVIAGFNTDSGVSCKTRSKHVEDIGTTMNDYLLLRRP